MEPTPALLKKLREEEIEDARQQTLAQKFWAGAELFDYACEAARIGIRMQHPDFSEEQILDELRRRIELGAMLEARDERG
jgi:hypothetical protein